MNIVEVATKLKSAFGFVVGPISHGALSDLAADNHAQYGLTNPTHAAVTYANGGTTTLTVNGRNEIFSASASVGGTTWALTGAVGTGKVSSFVLELTNGGAFTQTWPVSVKWDGGIAPTLTAAGVDVLAFYTRDGGITWRGFLSAKDSK